MNLPLRKYFPEKNSITSTGKLTLGLLIGQIGTLLLLPFLSRIYLPEEWGTLSVVLLVAGIIAPLATLGMSHALLVPEEDRKVWPIFMVGVISLTFCSATSYSLLEYSGLVSFGRSASIPSVSLLVASIIFLSGIAILNNALGQRLKSYKRIAVIHSLTSLSTSVSQLLLGLNKFLVMHGLLIGTVIGLFVGLATAARFVPKYIRRVSLRDLIQAVKSNIHHAGIYVPITTISKFSSQAPTIFVFLGFGLAYTGQAAMAERLIAVPLALIGAAVATVFTGDFAAKMRKDVAGLSTMYKSTSIALGLVSIGTFLGLWFLAPWIFSVFFGSTWDLAGEIAQAMAIAASARLLANPLSSVYRIMGRTRLLLLSEGLRIFVVASTVILSILCELPIIQGVYLISLGIAATDMASWLIGFRIVRQK
jgi:O-antigen/teichoic acid export membrane protein